MNRINFLGCPMDVANMKETVNWIRQRIEARVFTQHSVVNVAKIVNMRNDLALDDSVRSCDLINIDGMGVVFGARLLGHDVPERVAGVDLFHELISMSAQHGIPVFLLGAKAEVVKQTYARLKAMHPGLSVAGYHDGYFWDDEQKMVNTIRESGARLLFVAISSPKKENFINRWKDQLGVDFVMGVGGTFDVVAGEAKRAPKWIQDIGFEWFFRLAQEPGRMWKRYLKTNAIFLWLVITQRIVPSRLRSKVRHIRTNTGSL